MGLAVCKFAVRKMHRVQVAMTIRRYTCLELGNLLLCIWFCLGCNSSFESTASTAYDIPSPDLPGAPLIPKLAVLRPFCETTLGSISAGTAAATAFVIQPKGNPAVVVTVQSLLTQANGLSRDLAEGEHFSIITGVTLGSAFGEMDGVIIAEKVLDTEHSAMGDVMLISLPEAAQQRLGKFAPAYETPTEGTRVWLSAALFEGAPPSQRQHSAVVTGVDGSGHLTYKFDNPNISFQGTAGAPIVNSAGEVVAIHLHGSREGESLVANGNPTARWLPTLLESLKR